MTVSAPMTTTPDAARPAASAWRRYGAVALGGVVLGLAYPGYVKPGSGLDVASGLLACFALVPFFLYIGRQGRLRDDFKLSLACFVPFLLALNYWLLAMHPLMWLGIPFAVSIAVVLVAWLGVSAVIGLGMALGGMAYGYLVRRFLAAGPAWALPLLAAAFWPAFEWAQTQGDLAYPWGPLALSQVAVLPMLQLLPLGGPYLIGSLLAGLNASLAEALRGERRPAVGFAVATALALGYGTLALRPTPEGTLPVAVVQGNHDSAQKWSPASLPKMADFYISRSLAAEGAKIVVWPESAIPMLWNDPGRADTQALVARIRTAFETSGRYLVTGAFFFRPRENVRPGGFEYDLFNAATAIGRGLGADFEWEAKRHLVPFGEFMPFRGILPDVLAKLNVLQRDLTRGEGPRPFKLPGASVGTGVCFDSIFPRALADDAMAGATVLAVVTNDAWYKDTAAPHQHFAHSILRAVENRRFMLRAANTGISGIIDPYGRVLARSGVFVPAVVEGTIAPLSHVTPYTRIGDWPALLGLATLLGLMLWTLRARPLGAGVD
ncbi:MAG: apolipoprotein N-acyltransferase [Candidatus Sericytochromatia bacterium]|nr:apolipoprotein N-acyltransferase [Candidatus Tanganyikabacteria bacterium]